MGNGRTLLAVNGERRTLNSTNAVNPVRHGHGARAPQPRPSEGMDGSGQSIHSA
jgi:hypothetical protein